MSTSIILRITLLTLITLASKSLAQPFTANHPEFGTSSVTVDPSQKLMFLDLTVTDNVSFPAMPALLEPGATYDGWRYATRSEVAALLNTIGWSPPITDLSIPNLSSTSIASTVLEDFLGVITDTSVPPNTIDIQSAGFLADGDGVTVSYFDNIVQFSTAAPFENTSAPPAGHWLVRDLASDTPTYQGTLAELGEPVDSSADFRVTLVSSVGAPLATTEHLGVVVARGLFSLPLSFDPSLFEAPGVSLRIDVRAPSGVGEYERAVTDQPVTPSPRALFADRSGHADLADHATSAESALIAESALVADTLIGTDSAPIPVAAGLYPAGQGIQPPAATRQGAMVTLSGSILNADFIPVNVGATIATLPEGYRPSAPIYLRVSTLDLAGFWLGMTVSVQPDGTIRIIDQLQGQFPFFTISLDGHTFPAAP
jgi:hypothetical protein